MKTKDEYIESLAAELKVWSAQIDLITAKAEQTAGMAKLKYVQELNKIRSHQQAAAMKMRELEDASDDAWDKAKETADKVWDDMRTGLASAAAKFQ
jgi:hypothetical protein